MTDTGSPQDRDVRYMQRCLELAAKGRGAVSPNPLVGCVIVKDETIIAEGYHKQFGGPHAEVRAIHAAMRAGRSVEGATVYVSLEPCFHHGKTPPCVDLLIGHRVGRVVAAVTDPNPLVNGKSVRRLRRAGIDVTTGVLGREARNLNAGFFTFVLQHRPFIALKTAQTSDGYIAHADGSSKWITNERSRRHVHRLRSMFDAVLVGAGTVIADNPMLNVRTVKGTSPLRIVLDGALRVPEDAAVITTAADIPTIIYTAAVRNSETRDKKIIRLEQHGAVVVQLRAPRSRRLAISDVLTDLASHQITSVLVEGGAETYRAFLEAKAADMLYQYTAPHAFIDGMPGIDHLGVAFGRRHRSRMVFGKDILDEYDLTYSRGSDRLRGNTRQRTKRTEDNGSRNN